MGVEVGLGWALLLGWWAGLLQLLPRVRDVQRGGCSGLRDTEPNKDRVTMGGGAQQIAMGLQRWGRSHGHQEGTGS